MCQKKFWKTKYWNCSFFAHELLKIFTTIKILWSLVIPNFGLFCSNPYYLKLWSVLLFLIPPLSIFGWPKFRPVGKFVLGICQKLIRLRERHTYQTSLDSKFEDLKPSLACPASTIKVFFLKFYLHKRQKKVNINVKKSFAF